MTSGNQGVGSDIPDPTPHSVEDATVTERAHGRIEAYDDEYPTCERVDVTLCIYGHDLDPIKLSSRLGLEPTSSQRRGDVLNPGKWKPRLAPVGAWFLSSEGIVTSKDARRHFDWLLDELELHAGALNAIQREGYRMWVSCWWFSKGETGGPTVNVDHMARFAALGLPLAFELM